MRKNNNRSHGKTGKSGGRKTVKSVGKRKVKSVGKRKTVSLGQKRKTDPPRLPVLHKAAPATETETASIAREFAVWAGQQTDKVAVEVRKSAVATQLANRGVSRAATILTQAIKAVSAEQEDAANERYLAEMKEQIAAEEALRRTPPILAQAEQILQAPNILTEMLAVTERLGHCGEEPTRSLVFLSAVAGITARSHEDAVHLILKGPSSGGKNAVVKRVFELLPKGAALTLSNTTQLGLVYVGESFPVLVFQEVEGVKGADYLVRQIMSEGAVTRMTAKGLIRTVFKTSVITTTTRERIHAENETRAFSITVSADTELTRRVIEAEALTATGAPRPAIDGTLLLAWREAISQLTPAEVVVPFANELAKTFPHEQVRARRDFQRTLNLVRTCALLHQHTRQSDEQGRIIAEQSDYDMVEPILDELYQTTGELTIQGKQVLKLVTDDWAERGKLIAQATATGAVSEKTVRTWLKEFTNGLGLCDERAIGGRLEYRLRKAAV